VGTLYERLFDSLKTVSDSKKWCTCAPS